MKDKNIFEESKPLVDSNPAKSKEIYPLHKLVRTIEILKDIIDPPLPADAWDAERGEL